MNTEPSRSAVSLGRWNKPYVWLTIAALVIIVFNVIIVTGFIRGFLFVPSILLQQYLEGRLASENTRFQFDITLVWVIVPIVVSATAAALIFLKKPSAGIAVGFGATAAHFLTDAIYVGYVWDGMHVLQSYTHATWIVRAISEYGGYPASIYVFYFFYLPMMTLIGICLIKGWKATKLFAQD